jgi:hypothetical protein
MPGAWDGFLTTNIIWAVIIFNTKIDSKIYRLVAVDALVRPHLT